MVGVSFCFQLHFSSLRQSSVHPQPCRKSVCLSDSHVHPCCPETFQVCSWQTGAQVVLSRVQSVSTLLASLNIATAAILPFVSPSWYCAHCSHPFTENCPGNALSIISTASSTPNFASWSIVVICIGLRTRERPWEAT
ncbi:unnamed protein product [Scytosiphon promiscuus]